LIFFGSSP